ncbi:2,3-diaminopropionate biosynthesis protein SbnB [Streptomyces sp. 15-116A]|uniref:2,3-diaminopropionate biosynthesis protein SbnB n=1 Tax=Streptomyces sp. 15-116A TaxID=2259035 RepID=UPI0021B4A00A|nr:2,3-diaminopropionate biosynthesis protein SbnB [Streptomyces sp. 15-116A]MCT7350772.1 2,3-diaminopropionate biosynthesis protein SbnB [Streptomyces sp. 15-116A]
MTTFDIVPGNVASRVLDEDRAAVIALVRSAYLAHEAGLSVNPDSYFLRFPEKPDARIIALPAYLGGGTDLAGIKWIASFPSNVAEGNPRASAVLVLNDYRTGYPIALLEAAGISAARTAASAALAARTLGGGAALSGRTAVIGAGVIARTITDYLAAAGWQPDEVLCHDLHEPSAARLAAHAGSLGFDARTTGSLEEALDCDLVVLATTAAQPYVPAGTRLRPGQVVLNISLRDLPPELLLSTDNVLDDVEHCMKAQTSPHLAEQLTGGREFVTGTLAQVLSGEVTTDPGRAVVFSPFGLGVLDLAVGAYVLDQARKREETVAVPGFFGQERRW